MRTACRGFPATGRFLFYLSSNAPSSKWLGYETFNLAMAGSNPPGVISATWSNGSDFRFSAGRSGFKSRRGDHGSVAQTVERPVEARHVEGSKPSGTIYGSVANRQTRRTVNPFP